MYESYYILSLCTPIDPVENTLKKIYTGGTLWDEFTPEYYNDNNYAFGVLFQQYIDSSVDKIYNPSTVI